MKDQFEALIKKLPHSDSRVPYTYHHDYLRQKVYANATRANIAQKKCWSEEELYATALVALLDSVEVSALLALNNEDLEICRQANEICLRYVTKLQEGIRGIKCPREIDGRVADRENTLSVLFVNFLRAHQVDSGLTNKLYCIMNDER